MSYEAVHDKISLYITGNGVVIHLPGLFEEAEKNLRKGKGEVFYMLIFSMISVYFSSSKIDIFQQQSLTCSKKSTGVVKEMSNS